MDERNPVPRLMLVTDRHRVRGRNEVTLIADAALGGVGLVQVREPASTGRETAELIRRLLRVLPARTRLLIHDRPRVAEELHVGLHQPVAAAASPRLSAAFRSRGQLYGRSVRSLEEARRAQREGVSYVVLEEFEPAEPGGEPAGSGLDLLREVVRAIGPTPLLVRGGITPTRVPDVVHAGAHGVVVCGAILSSGDPCRVAQALSLALQVARRAP